MKDCTNASIKRRDTINATEVGGSILGMGSEENFSFRHRVQTGTEPTQPPIQCGRRIFPWG
jgi:hypothetical protein